MRYILRKREENVIWHELVHKKKKSHATIERTLLTGIAQCHNSQGMDTDPLLVKTSD